MIVSTGKTVLHYTEFHPQTTSDEGVVILFLHEALGSIGQWKSFPEKLCYRLSLSGIIYERQGHGASSSFDTKRKADYLQKYAYEELPHFIEQVIPISKKIILLGHSDGGSIALLYASKFPERIHSIVTLAAHVINERETIEGIAPAVEAFEQGKLAGLHKYHGEKTKDLFYAWADTWRSPDFRDWDITGEIKRASFKGLFIQGENDQYGTEKQLRLIVESFGKMGTTILLSDCGHHPHLEQEHKLIDIIENWLEMNQDKDHR